MSRAPERPASRSNGYVTFPSQIGICVCPADGCQTLVSALRSPHANTTQKTKSKDFI
jgi:hypothetical protein